MVTGIARFATHFRGMESRYVIIGGTACDLWLGKEGFKFRETKDIFIDELPVVPPKCLIPLKARAHLALKKRRETGENNVRGTDVKKHRNDVFRLYVSLKPEDRLSASFFFSLIIALPELKEQETLSYE
jgi:hypothetical protein